MATIFTTTIGMEALGIFAVISGIGIRYWMGRRKFYRRNITGTESFKSYEQMNLIRFGEGLGLWIGNIFIIIGVLLFLFFLIAPNRPH